MQISLIELEISLNELQISLNELEISIIDVELEISAIELEINRQTHMDGVREATDLIGLVSVSGGGGGFS